MIGFLYGLLVGVIFANVCIWRMDKWLDEAWDTARAWQARAFLLLAVVERVTADDTDLNEFKQTAADIASLPEVEQ